MKHRMLYDKTLKKYVEVETPDDSIIRVTGNGGVGEYHFYVNVESFRQLKEFSESKKYLSKFKS